MALPLFSNLPTEIQLTIRDLTIDEVVKQDVRKEGDAKTLMSLARTPFRSYSTTPYNVVYDRQGYEHSRGHTFPGDIDYTSYCAASAQLSHPKEGDLAIYLPGR